MFFARRINATFVQLQQPELIIADGGWRHFTVHGAGQDWEWYCWHTLAVQDVFVRQEKEDATWFQPLVGPKKNDVLLFSGNHGRFSPFKWGSTLWWGPSLNCSSLCRVLHLYLCSTTFLLVQPPNSLGLRTPCWSTTQPQMPAPLMRDLQLHLPPQRPHWWAVHCWASASGAFTSKDINLLFGYLSEENQKHRYLLT